MNDEQKPQDQPAQTQALAVPQIMSPEIARETAAFDLAQRTAKLMAASTFVPTSYKDSVPNCFIAQEIARRLDINVLMVMQNLYIPPGGIPAWKSQFLVAMANPFLVGPMDWEITVLKPEKVSVEVKVTRDRAEGGKLERWDMPNISVRAYGTFRSDGKVRYGTPATTTMAVMEGWTRNPKYQSMPELMMSWRAAAFFVRAYFPDRLFGFYTEDEIDQDKRIEQAIKINPAPKAVAAGQPSRLSAEQVAANKAEATRQFQELLAGADPAQ